MKTQKLLIVAFFFFASANLFAQADTNKDSHSLTIGIPEVALLDIESSASKAITLNATAPSEAGEKVVFEQTNNELWINYSSIVGNNSSRDVTVQITDGDVPNGIELSVQAKSYEGDGEGAMGKAVTSAIVLNDKKATNIIEEIGSSYTGNGATKGHNLTYKISQSTDKDAYSKLNFDQSNTLTITYTLTDN